MFHESHWLYLFLVTEVFSTDVSQEEHSSCRQDASKIQATGNQTSKSEVFKDSLETFNGMVNQPAGGLCSDPSGNLRLSRIKNLHHNQVKYPFISCCLIFCWNCCKVLVLDSVEAAAVFTWCYSHHIIQVLIWKSPGAS